MILRQIPVEVLLASAYAIFLLAVAVLLEKLAKHSHKRTNQYELAGFRYHRGFDRWECPTGTHLVRVESDPVRQLVRYRAPAARCNSCGTKKNCTDSDAGREIEHHLELWLETGLHQFHRGVSLVLVFLAAFLLIVEAVRHLQGPTITLLGLLLAVVALSGAKLLAPIRRNPTDPQGPSTRLGAGSDFHWTGHREFPGKPLTKKDLRRVETIDNSSEVGHK